jgi:hyperosmotically inducible periplasmic protein
MTNKAPLIRRPTLIVTPLVVFAAAAALAFTQTKAQPERIAHYEEWLTEQVLNVLVLLPWYSVFDHLAFEVDGSEVTLLGKVTQPSTKSDAEKAIRSMEGVTNVINKIDVLPASPMDDQIRRAEFRAIYSEARLEKYAVGAVPPIHIVVEGGQVTLEGVVDSQADKDAAGIRAKTVPNVFSVTNNLRVEAES